MDKDSRVGVFAVALACMGSSVSAAPEPRPDDLVDLGHLDPTLIIEMRYATENNFLKKKVYDAPVALLRRGVAQRLVRVQATLKSRGVGLKIWDAYRPSPVQYAMWKLVPDGRFVANPEKGSVHNRGAAVDLTLVDGGGRELDMGSDYDDFSSRAFPESPLVAPRARANRRLLRHAMVGEGFRPLDTEWWHFDGPGARQYPRMDTPISLLVGH